MIIWRMWHPHETQLPQGRVQSAWFPVAPLQHLTQCWQWRHSIHMYRMMKFCLTGERVGAQMRRREAWRSQQGLDHGGPECWRSGAGGGRGRPGLTLGTIGHHCKAIIGFVLGRSLLREGWVGATEARRLIRRLLPRSWRDMTVAWPRSGADVTETSGKAGTQQGRPQE